MRKTFLPFSPPSISEEEIAAVVDTLRTDWITTGPKTREFETVFCEYIGAPSALALNSCTGALHVALAALGIGPGDEVITTPMTFVSTANVIHQVGATPILADVEPDTLNIDPIQVAARITPRTKALLPVHYGGHPADMAPLLALAKAHNLFVIEDAAHAMPATYEGQRIGTLGDFTAFSFYATKNLTTAEGGMLTANPDRIQDARLWSLHGMNRDAWKRYSAEGSWYYEVVVPGFKYNMTDIQASIGMVQLKRLESFQQRRREIVAQYNAAFSQMPEVQPPTARPNVEHAWHLYVLRLHLDRLTINRSQFIEELKERNIGTSVHFIPVHLHPFYRETCGWMPEDFPVAYGEYQRTISLPLHPRLSVEDVNDVIEAVQDVITHYRC
ncbi:MAG: DegT/DnrJ/EryC1/StrS aminotransferase family protein [Anaerolinea sp.]|mgnify:CR=1 FL=1|nr:DegT/DnrJ/EryC1/StrS aminotransferase family protein [Anaerolinea sp.]MCC6974579.1 DegT/DnrJ/EryC1/StrS aminotransferase family protein [Anaerolineae bacterium]CAG0982634.1 UDP-4-amino-4-deoxy-L-arabinose-oxoglutarate aminotransferase [Anaerolineae bacterium]